MCVFFVHVCVGGEWVGYVCVLCETSVQGGYIDEFHSIFRHRNWMAKMSCDAISQQHGDVIP